MRKFSILFLVLAISLSFTGCKEVSKNLNHQQNVSKEFVSEFIELFSGIKGEGLLKGYNFSVENCYNITPKEITDRVGCKIFKFSDSYATFLLYDNEIYPLGQFFGGLGIVDMKLWEFDNGGHFALIYTYSWGSGMHRSLVGYFDLKTREEIVLDFTYMNEDMLLERTSESSFALYHADIKLGEDSFLNLNLSKGKHLADIIYENSTPKVIQIQNTP